jgi:hypothetical protein
MNADRIFGSSGGRGAAEPISHFSGIPYFRLFSFGESPSKTGAWRTPLSKRKRGKAQV